MLIEMAYDVKHYQLSGAPGWLSSERFDVVAKSPAGMASDRLSQQLMPMLRMLLEERFKLATHREKNTVRGYALVAAGSGSKLQKSAVQETGAERPLFIGRRGDLTAERITVAQLAETLSRELDAPVSDRTAIDGVFALHLRWAVETQTPPSTAASDLPGIFTAVQEQLGLKLEALKVPVEMLVIDHVEKAPTEN